MEDTGKVPKSDNLTGGSRRGIPNKATSAAREAIALFVDGNAHLLQTWLLQVADGDPDNDIKPNPAKAFEMFQSVVEYHIPKLARTEHSGINGGPIEAVVGLPPEEAYKRMLG